MKANKPVVFQRKLIYVAVASCFTVLPAYANPTGATVVNGTVNFAAQGNTLTITNTPNAIINWQQFSIQSGETTIFNQQSAQSAVLNRVIGQDPSQILGSLLSNGRVFLINPNGIVFGAGAIVDVAGLVASTLSLSNGDFLAGKLNFTNGVGAGSIVNQGNISSQNGGNIYLIAPDIQNSGIITSPRGEILLAAGHTVSLVDAGSPDIQINLSAPATHAVNLGTLMSQSGKINIYASLIDQSGVINADSAVQGQNGVIHLQATQAVNLAASSVISAQGGGKIGVFADMAAGQVNVDGLLDASAPTSGSGGFIETSAAHVKIADTARVNTLSAYGNNGTWLIDPQDFTIGATGDITGAALSTNLAGGNVTILSSSGATAGNGDIFVNDAVSWSANTILTLTAVRNIDITKSIIATGPTSGINLNAGGMITIEPSTIANFANGSPQDVTVSTLGNIVINANGLTVMGGTAAPGVNIGGTYTANASLIAGGNMTLNLGAGGLTVRGGTASTNATDSASLSVVAHADAKIVAGGNLDLTINSGGLVTIEAGTATASIHSFNTNINTQTATANANLSGSNISMTLTGGSVTVRGGNANALAASGSSGTSNPTTNNTTAKAIATLSATNAITINGASELLIKGGTALAGASHEYINTATATANAFVITPTLTLTSGNLQIQGGNATATAASTATSIPGAAGTDIATATANSNLQATTVVVSAGSLTVQGGVSNASTSTFFPLPSYFANINKTAYAYTAANAQASTISVAGTATVLPGTAIVSGANAFAFANAVSSPVTPLLGVTGVTGVTEVVTQINLITGEINRSAPPRIPPSNGTEGYEDNGKPECS